MVITGKNSRYKNRLVVGRGRRSKDSRSKLESHTHIIRSRSSGHWAARNGGSLEAVEVVLRCWIISSRHFVQGRGGIPRGRG